MYLQWAQLWGEKNGLTYSVGNVFPSATADKEPGRRLVLHMQLWSQIYPLQWLEASSWDWFCFTWWFLDPLLPSQLCLWEWNLLHHWKKPCNSIASGSASPQRSSWGSGLLGGGAAHKPLLLRARDPTVCSRAQGVSSASVSRGAQLSADGITCQSKGSAPFCHDVSQAMAPSKPFPSPCVGRHFPVLSCVSQGLQSGSDAYMFLWQKRNASGFASSDWHTLVWRTA